MPPSEPGGNLLFIDYAAPEHPGAVSLDVVTPTYNRHKELTAQAKRLGPQLRADDRWIVIDDASNMIPDWRREIVPNFESVNQLFIAGLTYAKGERPRQHVNRARDIGNRLARMNSWIVEIDDHDLIRPDCLPEIRNAIARGALFIYGDCVLKPGDKVCRKPEYIANDLREKGNLAVGVRAFPAWLYHVVGGYRWRGPIAVGGNEFPAGDYGLFIRMEAFCGGQGFYRLPVVLCEVQQPAESIATTERTAFSHIAPMIAEAARRGTLGFGPTGKAETDAAFVNAMMAAERVDEV